MSGEFFLDTNILLYTFDQSNPEKQAISANLVDSAIWSEVGHISFQVVQECLNVLTRKFRIPMGAEEALDYLDTTLKPLCSIHSSMPVYERAVDIQLRWKYSWYDSLIISAALEAQASVLFTEDMQHDQKIESLTLVNPFIDTGQVHDVVGEYSVSDIVC